MKALVRLVRMSPAMVVSMIALLVALSGTAVAAKGLITGKQIKNGSITGADVKNKSLTARDFRGSVRGPRGLRGLTGATGAKGDKGDTGAQGPAGSARAFAWVNPSSPGGPSFVGSNVKNFVSVTRAQTGIYCLTPAAGIVSTGTAPVVSKEDGYSGNEMHFVSVRGRPFGVCPETDFEVYTYRTTGAFADNAAFTIVVP